MTRRTLLTLLRFWVWFTCVSCFTFFCLCGVIFVAFVQFGDVPGYRLLMSLVEGSEYASLAAGVVVGWLVA